MRWTDRPGAGGPAFAGAFALRDTTPEETLRFHGLRATTGRTALLAVLLEADHPLTHQEVLDRLPAGTMDRVSVYRSLHRLTEAGILHRAYVDGRTWCYETADRCGHNRCHPHFICRQCGTTTCMTDVVVPLARGIDKGYVPERQKVLIEGLCPRCAKR